MQLAWSHRKANSQCPIDSFYASIIASLEVGGLVLLVLSQWLYVLRTLGGHHHNSLGISLKFTRWLLRFQKKQSSWMYGEERGNSGKAISEFDFNSQIYSRCSLWILLTFPWPEYCHLAILNYWGFWENKYLTFELKRGGRQGRR